MPVRPRTPWSRPWPPVAVPAPPPVGVRSTAGPPGWWPSDDVSAWRRFAAELDLALDEVFGPALVDVAGGWATVSVAGGDVRLALAPLADVCAGEPARRWPALLRRQLSDAATARSAVAAVAVDDLDRLRPALRVRLVADGARSRPDTDGVDGVDGAHDVERVEGVTPPFSLQVADDLRAVLVIELATVRWTVARTTIEAWAVDPSVLVADVAARTVRLAWRPPPVVDATATTVLSSPSPFASALLLAPAAVLPAGGSWFVAAPTCHVVVVRPDRGSGATDPTLLAIQVAELHATGPCPLSPRVHRWSADDGLRPLGG